MKRDSDPDVLPFRFPSESVFTSPRNRYSLFPGTLIHIDRIPQVVPIDSRTAGGSQDLQIYDVVKLSHHFGVSVLSALYRLMNLRLITDKQFGEMKQMDSDGMSRQLAELLGLAEVSEDENISAFYRRYLVLALEGYRREKISRRKLLEIASKLGVGATEIERVVQSLGLVHDEPAEVLVPSV